MDKLFNFLDKLYSKEGFSFKKSVKVPWVGIELDLNIFVLCKNPTKTTLTLSGRSGKITFDQNAPLVKIPRFSLETQLSSIDFSEKSAILRMSGFPDLEYRF